MWSHFGQAEVQNLGVAAADDKNVGGLDVAMDDSFGVSGIQSIGNLNRQSKEDIHLNRLSVDAMLQRNPVQKLHGDKRLAMLVVNFIDRADVGMIQGRGRLGFALKTPESLRIAGNFVG